MNKIFQKPFSSCVARSIGFTLLEVLAALAIGIILTMIAVPSYRYFIQGQRALTLSGSFTSALAYARNEAIKRTVPVTICAASTTALTACGSNTNWTNGWIIFVDPTGSGVINANTTIIRTQDPLQTNTTFATNQARLTFDSNGFISAGTGTYTLNAPGCAGNNGRIITITSTGLASVAATACS